MTSAGDENSAGKQVANTEQGAFKAMASLESAKNDEERRSSKSKDKDNIESQL